MPGGRGHFGLAQRQQARRSRRRRLPKKIAQSSLHPIHDLRLDAHGRIQLIEMSVIVEEVPALDVVDAQTVAALDADDEAGLGHLLSARCPSHSARRVLLFEINDAHRKIPAT